MALCIENWITYEEPYLELQEDGWTLATVDGEKSAMYEEMVWVTRDGVEVLTRIE